jgi:hypothetical protein
MLTPGRDQVTVLFCLQYCILLTGNILLLLLFILHKTGTNQLDDSLHTFA